MNPATYYVPKGETRNMELVGITVEEGEKEVFGAVDGTALLLLVRIEQAETDDPLLLKQFGASDLLLAGLTPSTLDPGQEVEVCRYEDGGYDVELDPGVEDAVDAM